MKPLVRTVGLCLAILGLLVACAKDGDVSHTVDFALQQVTSAKKLVSSISTIGDANEKKDELAELGRAYASAMEEIAKLDQTNQDVAMEIAPLMPLLAAELQELMLEINSIQARNSEAAAVIIPELKNFKR